MINSPNPVPKKPWYKSRTLWVNVLSVVGGLASIPFTGGVPAAVAIASGVANIGLRTITTQPIGTTTE